MGAGTPLRSASVAGSVGDGPDADGTALEVVRTAEAGAPGRGGEGGRAAAVDGPRRAARPSAPVDRAGRRGEPAGAELRGGGRGFAEPPVGPFEGRGSTRPGQEPGAPERLSAALTAARLAAPPGLRTGTAGTTLDDWVAERLGRDGDPGVPWPQARPVATALADLLVRVHGLGAALRGLSADRVLVGPDGRPLLLDPRPYPAPRPGAAVLHRGPYADDRQALGGLLFLLATGLPPLLAEEFPEARAAPRRPARRGPAAALAGPGRAQRRERPPLTPVVLGLTAAPPRTAGRRSGHWPHWRPSPSRRPRSPRAAPT
ncbi:hypothetical protein ACFQ1I_15005 [Kitasatospora arboriphila]